MKLSTALLLAALTLTESTPKETETHPHGIQRRARPKPAEKLVTVENHYGERKRVTKTEAKDCIAKGWSYCAKRKSNDPTLPC